MEKVPLLKKRNEKPLPSVMDEMEVNEAYKVPVKPSYARQMQYHFKKHTEKRFRVWTKKEGGQVLTFIGRIA